jgi:hypothetical protein
MINIDERYKKGKIYKLISSLTTDVYIGSTVRELNIRLSHHKSHYKIFIKGESNDCTSYRLFEKGIDKIEIQLIEDYNCDNKRSLHLRERYWIENTINCINKFIPTRNGKEYYQANREIRLEQMKEYRQQEKAKEKTTCECGSIIKKSQFQQHNKTKKHTNYIASQLTNSITQLTI